MPQDDLNHAFSFVDEPRDEPLSLRPDEQKQQSKLWPKLAGFTLLGLTFAAFLNFLGIIPIPGLERSVKNRPQDKPQFAMNPPSPRRPDPAPLPRVTTPPQRFDRPPVGATTAPRQPDQGHPQPPNNDGASGKDSSLRARRTASDSESEPSSDGKAEAGTRLASKGIIKGTSAFVLQSESNVKAKLSSLRSRAKEYNAAHDRLSEIYSGMANLERLEQEVDSADKAIVIHDTAMGQFKAISRGGIWYHGMNMLENAQYEEIKAERDAIRIARASAIEERNVLRRRQPGRGLPQAKEALKIQGEAGLSALNEMREAIAATTKEYEVLANDDEVRKALKKVGQDEFNPSPDFNSAVEEFGVFEKSLGKRPSFSTPKASTPKKPANKSSK